MNILSLGKLRELPTHRLLAYKKALMKLHPHSYNVSANCRCGFCATHPDLVQKWRSAHADVISILNGRDHVIRKNRRH